MHSDRVMHKGQGYLEATEPEYAKVLESRDIFDIYDVETSPFARGKFGTVRRVVHKKTGVKYAAKFLRRRRRDQCLSKDINHEIAVLMLCSDSQHIINLHAVHETRLETALILELAHGGELQTLLDIEGCLTESQTIFCLREILKALQFMHKNNIAHLDVKPQNILMNGEKIEDGLKLCDFGISRVINKACEVREIVGTPDYVAPEILQYDPVSLKTDIWSVGVLAYVLLSGCSPFAGDTKQETFLNISKCNLTFPPDLFEDATAQAIDFITDTLQIKPHERLNIEDCLNHTWLMSANGTSNGVGADDVVCITTMLTNGHNGTSNGVVTTNIVESNGCGGVGGMGGGVDQNNHSDSGHSTASTLDSVVDDGCCPPPASVTIVATHKQLPPPQTITSCTISKNGSIIVEEIDEVKLLERQQQQPQQQIKNAASSDDKENNRRNCAFNGSGAEVAPAIFPDAPTTPKVIRKVAPIYTSLRTKCDDVLNNGTAMPSMPNNNNATNTTSTTTTTTPSMMPMATTNHHGPAPQRPGSVTVTVTINGDDRHASTTRIHICPPD